MTSPISVLYEDNHLLAVNKPAGMLVQGDETGDRPLVEIAKEYIGAKYHKPGDVFLGVVHRIDRPVSGVVVFARTSKALERMNELFRNKETNKIYWAIVSARPPKEEDNVVHWLEKDEKKNKTTAYKRPLPEGKRSELNYRFLAQSGRHYVLEVHPLTGRPHQIRVQLASLGCPIAGDLKYGAAEPLEDGNIGLHARQLTFVHPVKKENIVLTAGLPRVGYWEAFSFLAAS